MKREDIIRMAREADREWDCDRDMVEWLESFAALVAVAAGDQQYALGYLDGNGAGFREGREAEREALEKIDWTVLLRQGALVTWGDAATLADRVIAAIRARGKS